MLRLAARKALYKLADGHGTSRRDAWQRVMAARLVGWASVHSLGSNHPAHVHDDALLSIVYYAAVSGAEDGGGAIEFLDARGLDAITALRHSQRHLPWRCICKRHQYTAGLSWPLATSLR